jgi:hypothetical protein
MNCWHCKTELIWGGDHDCEDSEDYWFESNFHCPKCNTLVLAYYPREKTNEENDL